MISDNHSRVLWDYLGVSGMSWEMRSNEFISEDRELMIGLEVGDLFRSVSVNSEAIGAS